MSCARCMMAERSAALSPERGVRSPAAGARPPSDGIAAADRKGGWLEGSN